ncbi:MAG: 3-phosphoshikimate 1-carboxyvinyltransferase [Chloroflexi bacterium]|jgi:3-phosphoshikimate 1-carboxyvinyltransferase|nr:MAG: 3-phosphoshikimate 1-carboxyvinyltransferase [Chloroflexota bacterium]
MLRCLRGLGADISRHVNCPISNADECFKIIGQGLHGLTEPVNVLNAGNSGTTMRLVSGLLAAQPFFSVITGDKSLRSRPMDRIIKPLEKMGARIHGRHDNTRAPLSISGRRLTGIEYTMPVASAQLKSSIIIAGLYADGETILHQPAQSRDHTERMLEDMGASLSEKELTIKLNPTGDLRSVDVRVPTDTSSAAYWLVAAICHPSAKITVLNVGINPTRTGVIDALQSMGGQLTILNRRFEGGEEVADIMAESSNLKAIEISGALVPRLIDEIPVISLAACFAHGTTIIRDAAELRVKESDRIKATVTELSRFGGNLKELKDGMEIKGTGMLSGASGWSHGDHRLAMTLGVAGLLANGETEIAGSESAGVSYPTFWNDIQLLMKGPSV